MYVKFVHLENTPSGNFVIPTGRSISSKSKLPANAYLPILLNVFGNLILLNCLFWNDESPISHIPSSIITFSNEMDDFQTSLTLLAESASFP